MSRRLHHLHGHPDMREVVVPVATVWTSPSAPRAGLDDAALADVPDMAAWVGALDAKGTPDRRLGLHGRTLTQLLLNEPALVLEQDGEWSKVAALYQRSAAHEEGYPGWVRTAHLGTPGDRVDGPTAFVMAPSTVVTLDDGGSLEVSCGTGFWVGDAAGSGERDVPVLVAGGLQGTVPRAAVRLSDKDQLADPSVDDLLATARQFLGLPYLWGGTSAWGLDCSGLAHLTFRAHGLQLPRDASDQAASRSRLTPVPLDRVQRGDLYFFARPGSRVTHVGFATAPVGQDGRRPMLHAPEGGGLIEECPMTPERAATLLSAARLVTHH
jgi:cell wall-associated NlpC family hydrolase